MIVQVRTVEPRDRTHPALALLYGLQAQLATLLPCGILTVISRLSRLTLVGHPLFRATLVQPPGQYSTNHNN